MNKEEMKAKKEAKEAKLQAKKESMKGASVKVAKLVALALVPLAMLVSGCASQPSRSQTQTFKDCNFYVMASPASVSNAVADTAGHKPLQVGDILTQNMMIETGGNEANTQTSTPTTTTPIDLSYGVAGASGVDSLLTAGADRISGRYKANTAKSTEKKTGTAAAGSGGACSPGGCSDGSCEIQ